jgi:hypothetical protein
MVHNSMDNRPFELEKEMAPAVCDWLRRAHLTVKQEFSLPWGICDFVGVSLNLSHVRERLRLKQRKAIGPLWRVDLLRHIPDEKADRTISVRTLAKVYGQQIPEQVIKTEVKRLISDRFVLETRTGGLQRLNGWEPLQNRIVAIELKLTRISEALCQAASNRVFGESYVALPWDVAHKLSKCNRVSAFDDAGVGLLAVARNACRVVWCPSAHGIKTDPTLQMHCVERFWRSRGNSA